MSLFISAELGQLLVSKGAKFVNLFYITLIMVSLACTLSFFLPQDPSSLQILEPLNQSSFPLSRSLRQLMFDLYQSYKESWRVIKQAWKSKGLQVLSFWWAFNMAAMPMVAAYGTSLFEAIHSVSTYNGHVMAATQTVACLSSFTAVPLSRITDQTGGLGYFLGSVLVGSLCMVMAYANSIWIAYAAYVLIIGVTDLLFCLLVVQCAKSISNGQYILVFSFNALGGMIMQAVFQAIIEIIGISVFTLYFILGIHFFIVGLLFALICIAFYCKTRSIVLVPIESSLPTYGTFSVLETS
ncbi:hypothetical protein O6H91_01G113300 [Diphasiastrum complanatum]|uniref:Uncharacterized protein n=1 Tax=Diphasiastrum complanatum TaxID=34168 RepID=A0ACC2EUY0_DIPCM|nr:hypothetical protein O6H91_01G113300 [Diphasiastrum complanatum]